MVAFLARGGRRALPGLFFLVMMAGCQPTPSPSSHAQPRRIASLNLATDEILADLVPVDRVVMVSSYADNDMSNVAGRFPPSVPRLAAIDVERLLLLKPDLVLVAPYNDPDAVEQIRRRVPVYRYDAVKGMDDIAAGITALGQRLGEPARAKELVDDFQARRQALARKLAKAKVRPRVLYWAAGFTTGGETTINDLIVAAGGRNIGAELHLKNHVEFAPERVVLANPDFFLVGGLPGDEISGIYNHPILKQLPAVKARRVVRLEGRYLSTVSHHLIEGSERLARVLHPKSFPDGKLP